MFPGKRSIPTVPIILLTAFVSLAILQPPVVDDQFCTPLPDRNFDQQLAFVPSGADPKRRR